MVGVAEFATVTETPGEVVSFPASSLAFAVRVCDPREALVVFQDASKGAPASVPSEVEPSRKNSTCVTVPSSSAPALTETVPLTSSAGAGWETATVGATAAEPSWY